MQGLTNYFMAPGTPNDWAKDWQPGDGVGQYLAVDPAKTPTPPPKLTRAEAITKTREQWRWYAMNPLVPKEKYFEEHGLRSPKENCYLCEYTRGDCLDTPKPDTCGKICPLRWPGGCCVLKHRSGLHDLWTDGLSSPELRQSIAWLISRLPEKEE